MARAGEMISTMADALLLPEVTVGLVYRELRAQDLMSTTGRGRSASHVRALDIARLLIAILCTDIVREAAERVRLFGQLRGNRLDQRPVRSGLLSSTFAAQDCFERELASVLGVLAQLNTRYEEERVQRHLVHVNVTRLEASLETPDESYEFGPAPDALAEIRDGGLGIEVSKYVRGPALKRVADLLTTVQSPNDGPSPPPGSTIME